MKDCIFCKIVNGEIPAKVIYENELVLAIEDINPQTPVHVLLIPKHHYDDILDLQNSEQCGKEMSAVLAAVKAVADQYQISEQGFRLINNCRSYGGQTVMHLHFHLLGGAKLGDKVI